MELLFIRHGESIGNVAKQLQGQADFALSQQGEIQVTKLAQRLTIAGVGPNYIYSSPLRRAAQTADILITQLQTAPRRPVTATAISFQYAAELQELHNGILQGLTWREAQARYPVLCHALETTPEWLPIPGAESLSQVRDRASAFIQILLKRHSNSDRVWIVTHGGMLPFLIAELLGSDRVWGLQIKPTALFEFYLDLSRWSLQNQNRWNTALWQIRRFNDTQHLDL